MPPELSVVIPTHNRREPLRACLESFTRQSVAAATFEIVVVVDGSTDGTAEMVRDFAASFELRAVAQRRGGASAARNAGAGSARGRVLLFVDDDMTASRSLVSAHLDVHQADERVAGVGVIARQIPADADELARLRAEASRTHYEHVRLRSLSYLDCYGGNFSVARSVFAESGGFSVDLPVLNDFELGYRLHRAGVRFVFVPDGVVTERREDDWREIVADRELRGRTAIALYRRDPAIVAETELCGYEPLHGLWVPLRALCLALRVRPRPLARLGLLLPRRSWAGRWFAFAFSYSYWRGVASAVGYRELWRGFAGGLRPWRRSSRRRRERRGQA